MGASRDPKGGPPPAPAPASWMPVSLGVPHPRTCAHPLDAREQGKGTPHPLEAWPHPVSLPSPHPQRPRPPSGTSEPAARGGQDRMPLADCANGLSSGHPGGTRTASSALPGPCEPGVEGGASLGHGLPDPRAHVLARLCPVPPAGAATLSLSHPGRPHPPGVAFRSLLASSWPPRCL